ncbi:mitochondrial import inner membrane translocase subunit Tim23-like [Tropilaelaps mercedesae]|uniref:Mitochondrial import inner membrane translocase subunit Tim23-like n=1 Tax=Tropilaelaps mercedesae TaxID=418985 RepID=A0A1V9XPQ5_9ACAR|nr:mitochondrial import inner membrane translocase subunit Tim23-like [Tropilaelaps mercedesae]
MDRQFPQDQPTTMESTFPQPGSPLYSPYLNFDPSYLNTAGPEYIFPEGAGHKRGRFELAFSQIGSCLLLGSSLGCARGFAQGLRETNNLTGAVRRSQLINYTIKGGSGVAYRVGTIAVMYSAFGVLLSKARDADDEFNTVLSGGLTGLLYKSTAGLKRCGMGGVIGLGIGALYAAATGETVRKLL